MYTILIVDDEANLLEVLAVALENMGYGTVTAETAEEALAVLEEREVHLVLSDLRLPGLSGRELMEKVKAANPDLPVVIMTAYASLKEAVEIIKEGAFDYTVKPFELDALEATIASALRYYALGRDNRDLREQLQTASAGQFVGQSPAYLALLRNVREVSASSANVLITGESGTGKEGHPLRRPEGQSPPRNHQLRRHPRTAPRKRAVRPRQRRVHGRHQQPQGALRTGRRRHAVPRRNRGHAAGAPGEDPALHPGEGH